jgi:hypothetical protein
VHHLWVVKLLKEMDKQQEDKEAHLNLHLVEEVFNLPYKELLLLEDNLNQKEDQVQVPFLEELQVKRVVILVLNNQLNQILNKKALIQHQGNKNIVLIPHLNNKLVKVIVCLIANHLKPQQHQKLSNHNNFLHYIKLNHLK